MQTADDIRELRRLAHFLDTQYTLPLGIKIGWDGILGLVPVAGDVVTTVMSFYIVFRAAALGCPPSVLTRMVINIMIEDVVDMIPFFGNIFDIFWLSNVMNVRLLERYLENPAKTRARSRWAVFGLVVVLLLLILFLVYVGIVIIAKLFAIGHALWGAPSPSPHM